MTEEENTKEKTIPEPAHSLGGVSEASPPESAEPELADRRLDHWVVALDGDGTSEHLGGVVTHAVVEKMKEMGDLFFAIGNQRVVDLHQIPSAYLPGMKEGFPGGKSLGLERLRRDFPGYGRYVVVDDRPDQYEGGWKGWEFMSPEQFVRALDIGYPTNVPFHTYASSLEVSRPSTTVSVPTVKWCPPHRDITPLCPSCGYTGSWDVLCKTCGKVVT